MLYYPCTVVVQEAFAEMDDARRVSLIVTYLPASFVQRVSDDYSAEVSKWRIKPFIKKKIIKIK